MMRIANRKRAGNSAGNAFAFIGLLAAPLILAAGTSAAADSRQSEPTAGASIDAAGTVHIVREQVPYSSLASEGAKQNYLGRTVNAAAASQGIPTPANIAAVRKALDDDRMRPAVERLRALFPVTIKAATIGGIQTDVVEPAQGVAPGNKDRVLINLHGGGFMVGARYGGQQESIPIASLGAIKVITVDYSEWPESKYPAASESVVAVYRELLKTYKPGNVGIYGCSSGGLLTAESLAWLQETNLPAPGAAGIFGAGALVPTLGDSQYVGAFLMGEPAETDNPKKSTPYFDLPALNLKAPLVAPVYAPATLSRFPPTLVLSGTRDSALSSALFTHAQLAKLGVDAELHVWEGGTHCAFAQPIGDPDFPENREAWNVIVRFFSKHLGKSPP